MIKQILFLFLFLTVFGVAPVTAKAARFYLSPASGNYKVGDTVTASVYIDSQGQAINAGEGTVTFASDILEYQSVSTGGSIFTFWTNGPSGGSTVVSFGGGASNPGYTGSGGKVLSITWKAKANGAGNVSINGTKILANDGLGTNVYSGSSGGTFTVATTVKAPTAPKPTPGPTTPSLKSSTHPDQAKWYSEDTVNISWAGNTSYTGFAYAFDQSSSTTPPDSATISGTEKTFDTVADGIWYFHLKAKTASGYTAPAHFRVQIDTRPPDEFSVTINQEGGSSNPSPIITFDAKDSTSGIDRYEAIINSGELFGIKSGDTLPKQKPGTHVVLVKAYDKAGNLREGKASYKIEGISPPTIVDWTRFVGLLNPIRFVGRSSPGDTIYVYLRDKEVDKFVARDKQVPNDYALNKKHAVKRASAGLGDEITWEYVYNQPLFPDLYSLRFARTNEAGAESESTQGIQVRVSAETMKIAGRVVPTNYVVVILVIVIIILSLVILYLLQKLHALAKRGTAAAGIAFTQLRRMFSTTERTLDKKIDAAMPDHELTKTDIVAVKEQLKTTVHETLAQEQEGISK